MQIELIVESMLLPRLPDGQRLELPDGASAADAVAAMEQQGLTGSRTAAEVLSSHMLLCNSRHCQGDAVLHDGDRLILMKTLLGG